MLDNLPFIPSRIKTHQQLVLIPFCHNRKQWNGYKKKAQKQESFLGAEIHHFDGYTIITGFMGYPHLLTLLAGIENWREKTLFWLGTAGSLNDDPLPDIATVSELTMTPELQQGWGREKLSMNAVLGFTPRFVVTVDIAHRETQNWLEQLRQAGLERVEMELYPLRSHYKTPFQALLVGSDRVCPAAGAETISYKKLVESFSEAFSYIMGAYT